MIVVAFNMPESSSVGAQVPACLLSKFFFQFTFAATASTLVSGALAERCNFIAYLVYCNLITGRYRAHLYLYQHPAHNVSHWSMV